MRPFLPFLCAILLTSCSNDDRSVDPGEVNMMNVDALDADMSFDADTSAVNRTETASERRERLREKAKSDPDGADAEAIDNMSRNEVLATAINSAGYLCARVVSAYPVGDKINVECVEYRNGTRRVRYSIDAAAGTVDPR